MSLDIPILSITDPSPLECGVFDRLQIVTYPTGGTVIAWGLKPGFKAPGPYHFFVDFGRSGQHEFQTLNKVPIVDDCVFSDPLQRYYDHLVDFYYRIRLVLPNSKDNQGNPIEHSSQPHQANGMLAKRDWLIARDITRKEYLLHKKRTNVVAVGWILKRRRYGQPCTRCMEPDTGEVQNTRCPECFGTGFIGGYFPGIDFRFTMDVWSREFKRDPQVGNTNNIVRLGRCVSYPYLDTNDIYIRRDNGTRFYVNKLETAAEIGGIPLIMNAELKLAPVTDIIYTVPVTGGQSSSSSAVPVSSSSSSPTPEWRAGLKGEEW